MFDRLFALELTGIKLGLDNISRLCAALDHPERAFATVHIAGTNGKGSVTAMVHEALVAAGYRAARYTSPHLSDLRERFVVDAEPVTDSVLGTAVNDVLDCAERLAASGGLPAPPTFFEAATATAFEIFRRAQVEIAVVEVGLGGRFDATNIVSPQVGAITSIGLDHQQYLGHSLAEIAFEKAGVIKPAMRVVTGHLPPEAARVIDDTARARGARVVPAHEGVALTASASAGVTRLTIRTPTSSYGPVNLGLRGDHQVGNAVVAVRVLELLAESGMAVLRAGVEHGLSSARWPARLELITWPDRTRRALIDAAHNPDGAQTLAAYLRRWHPEPPPIVLGVMRDKDLEGIVTPLLPVTSTIIATAAPASRAMPPDELARRVRVLAPTRTVLVEPSPASALDRGLELAPMVCIAGSIFLAGAVRDVLKERAILR